MSKITKQPDRERKKAIFGWMHGIEENPAISSGTKRFAAMVATKFVNRGTFQVIWANKTMAAKMWVSVRMVQRYIAELEAKGLIAIIPVEGVRRAFQIVVHTARDHGNERDTSASRNMTVATRKHDKAVVPYSKNQNNNQYRLANSRARNTWLKVLCSDFSVLNGWKFWLTEHFTGDPEEALKILAIDGGYALPCRYPGEGSDDVICHSEFIELVRRIGSGNL